MIDKVQPGQLCTASKTNEIIDAVNLGMGETSEPSEQQTQFDAGGLAGGTPETSDTRDVAPFDVVYIESESGGTASMLINGGRLYEFSYSTDTGEGEEPGPQSEEEEEEETGGDEIKVKTTVHEIEEQTLELSDGDEIVLKFEINPKTLKITGIPTIDRKQGEGEEEEEGATISITVGKAEAVEDYIIYRCQCPNSIFWHGRIPAQGGTSRAEMSLPFQVSIEYGETEEPEEGEEPEPSRKIKVTANGGTVAYFEEGSEDLSVWKGQDKEFASTSNGYVIMEYDHEAKTFELKFEYGAPRRWESSNGWPVKSRVAIAYVDGDKVTQLSTTSFLLSPLYLGEKFYLDFMAYQSQP